MYIFTMHIRGTLYALLTRYIQCTLEVVKNALNSSRIEKEMTKKNGGGSLFLKAMMSQKGIPGSTSQMTPIQDATSGQHAWSAWRQRSIKNLMSKLGKIK